ncbi:MAG: epimerase [Acidobacteria bacterium]|nr:MAG: epimerase [Acidobacteriota bacterium]
MSEQRQRVLLTGGAGFIGSHLAEALLRRGAQLTIVDNLDSFYDHSVKKANLNAIRGIGEYEFHALDICDMEQLSQVMAFRCPEVVIHLAACVGVRPSIGQPKLYERVNVAGTLNLLELCRQFHVSRFIFGSSSSVYGATSCVPFSENHVELRPLSPYAATKLAGEMLAYTYAHLFGLQVICLRFFTVYGPRQRPDLAIRKFTELLEAGKPLPIFGDGSMARDYTYVDDVVAGILASIDLKFRLPSNGAPFEVFNLGNSHPVKLTELIELLENVTGRKATCEWRPPQPGDSPVTWADTSKAARILGYRPATPLKEGLSSFVRWYRDAAQGCSEPPEGLESQTVDASVRTSPQ